jgi:hypothetical protein
MTEKDTELTHLKYLEDLLEALKEETSKKKDEISKEKVEFFNNEYAAEKLTKKLAAFFKERDMAIVKLKTGARSKDYYDVAKHIWNAKKVLIPFIKKIPDCVRDKTRQFNYNTKNLSKDESGQLWNFCTYIQDKKKWFTFEKADNICHVQLAEGNQHLQFFNGGWAEEISIYIIVKALNEFKKQAKSSHKLFWNVCLKKFGSDNQRDMELDLIVQIKDRFYIFEVKTGKVLLIDNWVDRTRLFNSEKSEYITCTSNKNLEPKTFSPYVLFALPTLEKQFLELLNRDFPQQSKKKL